MQSQLEQCIAVVYPSLSHHPLYTVNTGDTLISSPRGVFGWSQPGKFLIHKTVNSDMLDCTYFIIIRRLAHRSDPAQ